MAAGSGVKARVDDRRRRRRSTVADVAEHGRTAEGETTSLDRRLFMQLQAFGGARDTAALVAALEAAGIEGALYEDVNDPTGVALLTLSETPDAFVDELRGFLQLAAVRRARAEAGADDARPHLRDRLRAGPRGDARRAAAPARPRPGPALGDLVPAAPGRLVRAALARGAERDPHGARRRRDGVRRAGLGYDIRLACHGLDRADNDFVVGLLGPELHPLSVIVQRMRKTRQTSLHLERLGPFFVGRVAWQSTA